MATANDIVAKLAGTDARKIVRWVSDRLRDVAQGARRRAARRWMQARDAIGRPGKLPPGSLDASCARDAEIDDRFYLERHRRHGPIFKLFWGSGHLKVCVVGFPLARRLLTQHRDAVRPETVDITSLVPAEYLRSMSPAIHPRYRRLFIGALRDDLVAACEPELRSIVRTELASLAGSAPPDVAPPQRLYAALDRMALAALVRVVFGVAPGSDVAPVLERAYRRMGPDGHIAPVGEAQAAAFRTIREAVLTMLPPMRDPRSARFGDCILRRLARADTGRETAIDETVIGNAIYMVERGRHDVRDLFRWLLKYLSEHDAVVAELRTAGPSVPGAEPRLAEACVLETLRLDQAELLKRKAVAPFTFDGYRVPRNSWVAILLRESHRDPRTFVEPDAFCPHRFLTRTYSGDEYAPFGIDEHQCIAATLVRRVGALFVEELVDGFSWTVASDGPRRHGHFHWEPSPSFAIDLRRNDRSAEDRASG